MWRDNGWCLGSAGQRRRVLREMLSQVGRGPDRAAAAKLTAQQREDCTRLAAPRIACTTQEEGLTPFYEGIEDLAAAEADPSYILPPREPLLVLGFHEDIAQVTWKGKPGCVHADMLAGVRRKSESQMAYLQARQGECWRRKGTHTDDILLKADTKYRSSRFPSGRFWLYDSYHLTKQAIDKLFNGSTKDVTQTLAYTHLKKILNKIVKKSQKECAERFGILLDIITTNSLIQTGIPHELGNAAYGYIETAHYDKLGLKFCFIGITDNVNCRAARDVFCRDPVRFDSNDSKMPEEPKRAFDALDNQHMYCVFPAPTSQELLQEDTRVVGTTTLKRGEFVMPKRTIPPPVKRDVLEEMRSIASQSRRLARTHPAQAKQMLSKYAQSQVMAANEAVLIQRPGSAPGRVTPSLPHQPEAVQRPGTAMDDVADRRVVEVAHLLHSNPAAVFAEGGLLSTSGDAEKDPVELLDLMKKAKALNKEGALAATGSRAGQAVASPAATRVGNRVVAMKSGNHLKSVLTKTLSHTAPVAILFGAAWSRQHLDFLPKFSAIAQDFPEVVFMKVDVERFVEESWNCFVSSVPTLQVYHKGKLVMNTASPEAPALHECIASRVKVGSSGGLE